MTMRQAGAEQSQAAPNSFDAGELMASSCGDDIYKAMIDGAYEGLAGESLMALISLRCPSATPATVRQAALTSLGDADLVDLEVLGTVCGIALTHFIKAA